jgi:hypothetical protein
MPEKVLVFSRFPKTLMQRIGEKFELLDAGGKPPNEMFSADELGSIRAMITAGGAIAGQDDGFDAEARRDRLLRHRL